jgi:hypothetical protein
MADVSKTIILRYDVDTKKLIDANGKAVTSVKQLISATQQAAAAQQKMGDVMGKNTEVVIGSAQHIQAQITYAKQQRQATATNNEEWLRQTMIIKGLEHRYQKITQETSTLNAAQGKTSQSTRELAKLQENQARSAGLAGAAAFELGRTISDMPFGLVAVSNNISQLGTLFAALVANAKGVGNAMTLIGQQLIGPGGILIAFQIVTAAITYFAQQSNKAKEEVAKLNLELEAQAIVLKDILDLKRQGAITSEEENKILENYADINKEIVKLSKEGLISEQEKNDLLNQSLDLFNLRAAEEKAQSDRDEQRKSINEEILNLEKERTSNEEFLNKERRRGSTDLVLLQTVQDKIQSITDEITKKESQKLDIVRQEASAKADIEIAEKNIAKQVQAALDAEKERQKILDKRADALESLVDAQIDEEQGLVDQAILDKNFKAFQEHYKELSRLRGQQLFDQQAQELEGVTDQTTINAIEEKYRLLFKALNEEIEDGFRSGLMEIIGETLPGTLQDKLSLLDLIDGPDKTEAEKWAEKEVKTMADAVASEFQKRVAQTPELNGKNEGVFDFAKAFGLSKENLDAVVNATQVALSSLGDILGAQAEKEIAIETNKTNALNDQLRQRLANEQMSADERDKINQQIAKNEAELVRKENKINEERFKQEKAVNIALATVNTFSAATGVLAETKGGSIARIAGMIAVITAGLAQIAVISKQQFTAKAMPRPNLSGQGTSGGGGDRVFNVVGATPQTQIAEAIAAAEDRPVKAYVVSSDVTSAQELDRRIVEGASI